MSQDNQPQLEPDAEFNREVEIIDKALLACKKDFEELMYKRLEIMARRFRINVPDLVDCLLKADDVPKETAELISSIAKKKVQSKSDYKNCIILGNSSLL